MIINFRTPANAAALAAELAASTWAASKGLTIAGVGDLTPAGLASALRVAGGSSVTVAVEVVVSTVPAGAAFTLPNWLLPPAFTSSGGTSENGGVVPVVLDVVYKPALTALVRQASAAGCPVVPGATMLLEQVRDQKLSFRR